MTATPEPTDKPGSLLVLAVLSLLAGAFVGLVGALFRLSLQQADLFRAAMVARAHGMKAAGFLLVTAGCAAAAAIAAGLVRRFSPEASGSGIPHVEAVLTGEIPAARFTLLPVKFFGGVIAIGAGLALGREGPSVQLGAGVARLTAVVFRRNWADCRALLAAGAGAGLATAFNAPIAGSIFVLEELVRRFETRMALAGLGASATAIAVTRIFLVDAPDFSVKPLDYPPWQIGPLFFVLGAVAGLLAVVYNRTLLATVAAADRLKRWPVEARAACVGAAVGVLAWFTPGLVGGGESITQRTLDGTDAVALVPLVFLLRLALGAVSYAVQTPGGLFAPMLVLGAQIGLVFGAVCQHVFPGWHIQPEAFAVIGMAAFLTGVVRSPITGIVLIIEMTGSFSMLLSMLGACFTAMLVATLLRDPPVYDSLREKTVQRFRKIEGPRGVPEFREGRE